MKKIFLLALIALMIVVIITSCMPTLNDSQPYQQSEQPSQLVQQNQQDVPAPTQNNGTDNSGFIGEERAKQIALERAGIGPEGVLFDRVELDRDDGIWQYEIEFRLGRTEYDADIKADDGTVISFESDYDD